MTSARRVVHVSQPVDAGVAGVVFDLVQEQREAGWSVRVLCPDGPLAERTRQAGVPWSDWPATRAPGLSVITEVRALRSLLAGTAPELVHLHSSKAGLAGRLALRGRLPTVFQPHAWSFAAATGIEGRAALGWERFAVRWTALLLCCSTEEQEEGVAQGVQGASTVVPNGVDLRRFAAVRAGERASVRARLGITPRVPVAVCIGRLSHQKGQDVAVQAWEMVRREVPGAELLLIGDGPTRDRLLANVGPGVRVLGERADVPALLAASDLAVLPSRWEGLALALLEAMATGLAVVATRVAGSASTLTGGDLPPAGAVVPIEDPRSLAGAVVERLADPVRARAEGRAGRQRVERDHDRTITTKMVREAYGRLLVS